MGDVWWSGWRRALGRRSKGQRAILSEDDPDVICHRTVGGKGTVGRILQRGKR